MKWKLAVKYMKKGGRITRKHWLAYDYLYIDKASGLVFCDGDFEYVPIYTTKAHLRGEWIKSYV